MKYILTLLLTFYGITVFGQKKEIKRPKYIILVNNKFFIKKDSLMEYGRLGYIKTMKKGASEEEYNSLHAKFGNIIGDKEFIMRIELRTEEELAEQKRIAPKKRSEKKAPNKDFLLSVNDKANNFTVNMIDGQEITLKNLKGKVILLNFWATWCAPCLMEFSEIPEKILTPFSDKNFIFIPIAIGQKKETVSNKMKQLKKYGIDFNVGYDTDARIWDQYAQGSIPKNFLIDKKGIVQFVSTGNSEGNVDKIALEIKKLLNK
jgi:peroxiredoxin